MHPLITLYALVLLDPYKGQDMSRGRHPGTKALRIAAESLVVAVSKQRQMSTS